MQRSPTLCNCWAKNLSPGGLRKENGCAWMISARTGSPPYQVWHRPATMQLALSALPAASPSAKLLTPL